MSEKPTPRWATQAAKKIADLQIEPGAPVAVLARIIYEHSSHDGMVALLGEARDLADHVMEGANWMPGKSNHPFVVQSRRLKKKLEAALAAVRPEAPRKETGR